MKTLLNKFRKILSEKDVWFENCQMKPKPNQGFEEEIWVERMLVDTTKTIVTVQYREVDETNAPRFYERIEKLFTPEQTKFLLDIAQNQPTYEVNITGGGTKGEIIAALEKILTDVRVSDICEYEVEGATLLTEINLETKMETIKARSIEDHGKSERSIEFTEEQKNIAVDSELIHYDGTEWRFFIEDLQMIESLKKAH